MKILVAEDDVHTRNGLLTLLESEGYEVTAMADGEAAWNEFQREKPDLVCLDVMMPKLDGYKVCQKIRANDSVTPVLFISAKSEEMDTVLGLELGADDFIIKPFGVREVLARVRSAVRRSQTTRRPETPSVFYLADIEVHPSQLCAKRDNEMIDLSPRDIKILELLQRHPGEALGRDTIFDKCWGINYFANSRTLDQHISQLRKKIERDPSNPVIIQTVHGVGYRYLAT